MNVNRPMDYLLKVAHSHWLRGWPNPKPGGGPKGRGP